MQLLLKSNDAQNPITLDLTYYIDVERGKGMDPASPTFSEKVFTRSLLKEGGTLALESLHLKELVFPLKLNATSSSALAVLVQQINQVFASPGATCSWQDDGVSQPTIFDLASGQYDVEYDYRQAQKFWLQGKLRIFAQPLGRTAGPRAYAAASGVGPLLMISPYASGGQSILGASTQAGVAGFGGAPGGASSGVFYQGAPSLAGDAPALLQISYVGPEPNGATNAGQVPFVAVSLLPDANYQPLITMPQVTIASPYAVFGASIFRQVVATAPASQYISLGMTGAFGPTAETLSFSPLGTASQAITALWAGSHRLLAIARASARAGALSTVPNALVPFATTATVYPGGDWNLYDLGTFSLRASEVPQQGITVAAQQYDGGNLALDIAAFAVLPDNATWFLNPTAIQPSQYGYPPRVVPSQGATIAPYTNTILLDDTVADQFIYSGASQTFAPSPTGMVPSSARITQFTRGNVPRPNPYNGVPIIAIIGVGQTSTPSMYGTNAPSAAWLNAQNLRTMAQVNAVERARYILP